MRKSSQRVAAASGQWVAQRRAEGAASLSKDAASAPVEPRMPPAVDQISRDVGDKAAVRSERIELRTTSEVKALLQHAAALSHKTVSAFLLDAGIAAAEEALAEQRLFQLSEAEWRAFEASLDSPVTDKPRLAALLREKSVLE